MENWIRKTRLEATASKSTTNALLSKQLSVKTLLSAKCRKPKVAGFRKKANLNCESLTVAAIACEPNSLSEMFTSEGTA